MGAGETAGIVVVTVAIIQGLLKLGEHLINKYTETKNEKNHDKVIDALEDICQKINVQCGLNELQSQQLKELHDWHSPRDADGVPLWYVPRSWTATQQEIVNRIQRITEIEFKILSIIERLERRLEAYDRPKDQ